MKKLAFYIVDVFAEEKYAGNQLAVVRGADGLSGADMQKLARETNFSETTFIVSETPRDGGYDVRIFTPKEEVPFAGHPTLGTALVLMQEVAGTPIETLILNLKVGPIPVRLGKDGVLWMEQKSPAFGPTRAPEVLGPVLGIEPDDVDDRFPIQEVSTGLPFIIVPLKTLAAVKRARSVTERYFELVSTTEAKGILIFCPATYHLENQLNARMFADYYGVPEDPATGSANGCLAAYLVRHRYFGEPRIDIRVEQGYEIGRPSLLRLRAEEAAGRIRVQVGGRVILVAWGEFV
jgi:trans-2,3-dihydro-3-hydroxyanthranilate isomerase